MRAINGFLENGRFTPLDGVELPKRTNAILVIQDTARTSKRPSARAMRGDIKRSDNDVQVEDSELRAAWLERLGVAIDRSLHEDFPDIKRSPVMRDPLNLSHIERA